MAKFHVVYDRSNCIGAAACAAISPKHWVISDEDGKANLIGGIERDNGFYEREIDAADYKEVLESAQACPVVVIKIYNQNGEEVN